MRPCFRYDDGDTKGTRRVSALECLQREEERKSVRCVPIGEPVVDQYAHSGEEHAK